ncbi:Crp/Fnr family transcriptional regulator [Metabacillus sp. HB246100]
MNEFTLDTISPWIDHLPFDWSELEKVGTPKTYEVHKPIFFSGDLADTVYLVLKGRVRLYLVSPDGKEKAIAIIGENGLIGDRSIRRESFYLENAITAAETHLISIPSHRFKEMIKRNNQLSEQWIEFLQIKLELLAQDNLYLSFGSSLVRICDALCHLVRLYGQEERQGGYTINMTFTHQELANLIGATRVTVVNTLKQLINQSILVKQGKYYHIPDLNKLINLR